MMNSLLKQANYDEATQRAYVEFRAPDDDGGDTIVTAIFSYRNTERLSALRLKEDIIRKARHLLRRAQMAT